jgi:hypothetical protein
MKPPETPKEWAAHRIKLTCDIALEAIREGKSPTPDISLTDYCFYCMFQAMKEFALIHTIDEK